jgi:two-component system, cell cycle sensor histidine kinase and response regulator CckA
MAQLFDRRMGDQTATRPDTILLAEADRIVRTALRRTFETDGHMVLEASNGHEAVRICQQHDGPIDVFLADISLPGPHGPELARAVTSLRPFARVLFLTGESDQVNAEAGICPGCWLLVRKPFRPRDLAQALQEFLGRQMLRADSAAGLIRIGLVEEPQALSRSSQR